MDAIHSKRISKDIGFCSVILPSHEFYKPYEMYCSVIYSESVMCTIFDPMFG